MLWLVSFMDVSFGAGLRVPLEDYAHYAGYGMSGNVDFRYFFTERFGIGIAAGGAYHFQRRFADSIGGIWAKQTTQVTAFPVSLNVVMSFYLAEGVDLLVSLGGGGNYALYNYERRVGIYDSTARKWDVREDKGSYKVGGYIVNFESAVRMTDFDVFLGVHLMQTELNRVDMLTGKGMVEKASYPVLYVGVRHFILFGI